MGRRAAEQRDLPLTPLARAREKMIPALRAGATFRDAATLARIDWGDWKRWRRAVEVDGERLDDPDVEALVRDARVAHSEATAEMMAHISAKAPADWKAAAWLVQYRADAAKRAADQRRAHHEARLAKIAADKAAAGDATGPQVIILPASLATPRSGG